MNLLCLTLSNEFNLATFIVGILSLLGVMINIVVTANSNKKKRYTDLITQRRIVTMQSMMDCSSNCIEALYSIMADGCNYNENLKKYVHNRSMLFYDTNYKSEPELELRDALIKLEDLLLKFTQNHDKLTNKQKEKIFEVIKVGIDYYQLISCMYCKCEWERAKNTALSVREDYDTKKEYFLKKEPYKHLLDSQLKTLTENTFEKITKSKD